MCSICVFSYLCVYVSVRVCVLLSIFQAWVICTTRMCTDADMLWGAVVYFERVSRMIATAKIREDDGGGGDTRNHTARGDGGKCIHESVGGCLYVVGVCTANKHHAVQMHEYVCFADYMNSASSGV